ncbi:5'-nucleotidase C-terminal domain-containing protein [Sphingobacterium sp. Mn56C]|uniref:5'-nucleotidase C-terminal domain-containing protein n=1 Tax=Sphingobacterium sp. Mn56C TaxID=3395261 RepID=UPI003BD4E80A
MCTVKKLSILLLGALSITSCKTPTYLNSSRTATIYPINATIETDSTIVKYYLPFKQQMESEMNRPIGYSEHFLSKSRSDAESLAGNFFADALLAIGKKVDPEVQIAIATKGGIRSELKQGTVTVGSMFEIMPFENTITVLTLSGQDIINLANFIAKTEGQPIAGFTLKIKGDKPADIRINGKELDVNATYKLVTYDYLANGGDYMEGVFHPIKRVNTATRVREGLIEYVEELTKAGKNINTKLDGRVTVIK